MYLLANVAYLVTLPFDQIQHAPADRVATATLDAIFPGAGALIMAVGDHDLDVRLQQRPDPGGRARLLRDGARRALLSIRRAAERREGAGVGAGLARRLGAFLVLPRTYNPATGTYGNLYSNLLDYVVSAALIFYILTIAGVFRLRQNAARRRPRPIARSAIRSLPALYIAGAATILCVLFVYRTATTWPGLIIVLLGVPVYLAWRSKR